MRWLAWGMLGAFLVLVLTGLGLEALAWYGSAQVRRDPANDPLPGIWYLLVAVTTPALGALVAVRRPANPVGWLLLGSGVAAGVAWFAGGYAMFGIVAHPGSLPAAAQVAWLGWVGWLAFVLPITLMLLWFPDGRPPGPRWRVVGWLAVAGLVVGSVGMALAPGELPDSRVPLANPFAVESLGAVFSALRSAGLAVVLVAAAGAVGSLFVRYRRADPVPRQQLKWLFWAAAVLLVLVLAGNLLAGLRYGQNPVVTLAIDSILQVGLPLAVAVAILRHRLYDIDRLIRRSLVYGGLWGLITLSYVAVAWALGVAATGRLPIEVAVLLTVLTTLAFQPVRRRLDQLADRLVFGRRRSGYALVADLGLAAGEIDSPAQLAERVAALVRQGLDLAWARVVLVAGPDRATAVGGVSPDRATAVDGEPPDGMPARLAVPLRYGAEQLGRIECGPPRDRAGSATNREVLDAIATQAALAAHDLRLTAELRQRLGQLRDQSAELAASRARIVAAQEGERRRIERNLHDGAQQELVALIAKARLARVQLHQRPDQAEATLAELQRDAQLALAGLRELAQGIHPTVLADRGLVEAIEDRTARLPIAVTVHADPAMRRSRFADAVEGAAFFAVSEALANVLKHAHTDRADVRLWRDGSLLRVEVADQGRGFDQPAGAAGLPRLADRIEALGGALTVHSGAGAGTTLSARLPAHPRGNQHA